MRQLQQYRQTQKSPAQQRRSYLPSGPSIAVLCRTRNERSWRSNKRSLRQGDPPDSIKRWAASLGMSAGSKNTKSTATKERQQRIRYRRSSEGPQNAATVRPSPGVEKVCFTRCGAGKMPRELQPLSGAYVLSSLSSSSLAKAAQPPAAQARKPQSYRTNHEW